MILQGNQRGGARDLALHLLKDENEHFAVHEIRGFVSDNLVSALNEAHAISRATKAKQFLFSLSLNPPPHADVSTRDFEQAIEKVEAKLGLANQPRVIVFHEKEGRRHCHAVWSRIDASAMRAIPLSFSKLKLMEVSRELFIQHGWTMPRGMIKSEERDPLSFTLAQWQQAKRTGKDTRAIKQVFQDCWAASDSQTSFGTALREHGYVLARGDRRGFVALDHACEVFAVSKWTGVRAKSIRARLAEPESLPSVDQARQEVSKQMRTHLASLKTQHESAIQARLADISQKRKAMVQEQRRERQALEDRQEKRRVSETLLRQARFQTGLRGLMDRVTGRHKRLRAQNKLEAYEASQRDQIERDSVIFEHMKARRKLQKRIELLRNFENIYRRSLSQDIRQYAEIQSNIRDIPELIPLSNRRRKKSGPRIER